MRLWVPQFVVSILLAILLFIYFIPDSLVNVGPGERGVMWRRFLGGTVTDGIYGEGLHIIWPWDVLYVYDTRTQSADRDLAVLTNDGVRVDLSLSIRYHPDRDLLSLLHRDIGPDYAEKVVVAKVEAVVRKAIGTLTVANLFSQGREAVSELAVVAFEEVAANYVQLDDVVVRKIGIPTVVESAINAKIEQEQLAESYEFRLIQAKQEAQRKKIEADGIANYNKIVGATVTPDILKWQGVKATETLATSPNSKIVVIGNGKDGLPVILNGAD